MEKWEVRDMSGHSHWREQAPAEPGRSGFGSALATIRRRPAARARRGLVAFALALFVALGTVLVIAAGSVQAMSRTAAFNAQSDDLVGLAAIASVLVCAFLGMIIVHRYSSTRQR